MMKRVIVHVGPGKCGSTSIQSFFQRNKNACIENVRYIRVKPYFLKALNCNTPSQASLNEFKEALEVEFENYDALILSCESLFKRHFTVQHICRVSRELQANTTVIGYSRRQSRFIASAYSQWLFRSSERTQETDLAIRELNLDSTLFSGLEKQYIACIVNDFFSARQLCGRSILDWHSGYNKISALCKDSYTNVRCGTLPKSGDSISLIKDFCNKAKLTLNANANESFQHVKNPSFDPDIIEAIHNAISFDIEAPGPHEDNGVLSRLSSYMNSDQNNPPFFQSKLNAYVDSFYFESNTQLCQQHNLSIDYFSPTEIISKTEILSVLREENHQRSQNKSAVINHYRKLSASMLSLCLQHMKSNSGT